MSELSIRERSEKVEGDCEKTDLVDEVVGQVKAVVTAEGARTFAHQTQVELPHRAHDIRVVNQPHGVFGVVNEQFYLVWATRLITMIGQISKRIFLGQAPGAFAKCLFQRSKSQMPR